MVVDKLNRETGISQRKIETYIVGEGDEALARVVSVESECFVEATFFVSASILRGNEVEVGELQLVQSLFIAHRVEQVLKVSRLLVDNFDRDQLVLSIVPHRGDAAFLPLSITNDSFCRAAESVEQWGLLAANSSTSRDAIFLFEDVTDCVAFGSVEGQAGI